VVPGSYATDLGTGIEVTNAVKLEVSTQMLQWVEKKYSRTEKTEGGGTNTFTCYCFSLQWSTQRIHIDPRHYQWDAVCGTNPLLDPGPPCLGARPHAPNPWLSGATSVNSIGVFNSYAPILYLGAPTAAFELTQAQLKEVSGMPRYDIDIPLEKIPRGWYKTSPNTLYRPQAGFRWIQTSLGWGMAPPSYAQIGDMQLRVQAYTTSRISGIAQQSAASWSPFGNFVPFQTRGSTFPPCSGQGVSYFRSGSVSAGQLFDELQSSLTALTIVMRVVCFFLLFAAFYMIGSPLAIAPDIIPCIGGFYADLAGCAVAVLSFFAALSLSLTVTALSWIFFRPLLGGVLLAVAVALGPVPICIIKSKATKKTVKAFGLI